jgi:uncharacterized protein DUF6968
MSDQRSFIASRRLWGASAEHGQIAIEIRIGQPYRASDVDWACPVAADGLFAHLADQHGADSFQALMLAQNLARNLLFEFVKRGEIMKAEDGDSVVDVARLFEGGV